jgi:hypothetical protein
VSSSVFASIWSEGFEWVDTNVNPQVVSIWFESQYIGQAGNFWYIYCTIYAPDAIPRDSILYIKYGYA